MGEATALALQQKTRMAGLGYTPQAFFVDTPMNAVTRSSSVCAL